MATTVAELQAVITADTRGLDSSLSKAEQGIKRFGGDLAGIGAAMTAAFTLPIASVGALGISFNAMREQAQIAFTQLLGSAEKADAFLRELAQFAATTPFEFPDLVRAAQKFTAVGIEAKNVIPIMTALGDAVSAFGGTSETINRVTEQIIQMIGKGKVAMEEMRIIGQSIPGSLQAMAQEMGLTVDELFKKMEKGSVSAAEGLEAMLVGLTKKFHGNMELQSQSFSGLMSTLKDTVRFAAGDITESLFKILKQGLIVLVEYLPKVVAAFQGIPDQIKLMTIAIAGVVAGVGPALVALGGLVALLGGPLTLAIVGVTGVMVAFTAGVVLNFNRIVQIISSSTGTIRLNFIEIARFTGAVLDSFQILARGAIIVFDIIVTGAGLMAKGVKSAFEGVSDAANAAFALTQNDMVGFATSMASLKSKVVDGASSIRDSMTGLASRIGSDLKNIGSHLRGEFANSFARAVASAGNAVTTTKRSMDEIVSSLREAFEKMKNTTKEGSEKVKKAAREMWSAFSKEMENAVEDLNKLFRLDGTNVHDYLMSLAMPIRNVSASVQLVSEALTEQNTALQKNIAFGNDWMRFINEAKNHQASLARSAQNLKDEYEDLSRSLPHAWNVIIDSFVKGGTAASVKVKGFANDIINVFDTMPGKWGNSLRRTLDEVNRWISFIDSAIKLVQRILGDAQTGLAGIFEGIAGLFTKTTAAIKGSTSEAAAASDDWAGALEKMSKGMEQGGKSASESAQKWVSALAAITGALATFFGTRNQGKGIGVLGGALAGAQIGAMFGGLGAAIGAGVGALFGLFGSGKSQAQKDAERQAAEKMKLDLQQTAQTIINSAIEGFDRALKFFENLEQFTAPRKAKFAEFWKAMKRLMDGFVELAEKWSKTSLEQAKAVAESIGPITEAISALPNAFTAISGHFGVAQSSIDRFFDDFSKIMDSFFERSEIWIDGISKRAMKVANRLSPVVALISAFGQALTDISGAKEPGDEIFAMFSRVLDKIVDAVANLSLKFDKAVLKTMANFAEKAGAALAIWKDAIESIKATVDIQAPSEQSVDNVVAGIELFINKLAGAVERLIGTDLARITAFANVIQPIAAAIKAWAETAEIIRGYTAVAAEVWDQIVTDFERGLVLLNLLILDAQLYVDKATIFKSLIDQGAGLIEAALAAFGSSISSAASALQGGLPQGGSPMSAQSFAASSVGASSATSAASQQTVVNVTVNGSVFTGEQITEAVMQGLERGRRQGRVAPSVFTGTPALVR